MRSLRVFGAVVAVTAFSVALLAPGVASAGPISTYYSGTVPANFYYYTGFHNVNGNYMDFAGASAVFEIDRYNNKILYVYGSSEGSYSDFNTGYYKSACWNRTSSANFGDCRWAAP